MNTRVAYGIAAAMTAVISIFVEEAFSLDRVPLVVYIHIFNHPLYHHYKFNALKSSWNAVYIAVFCAPFAYNLYFCSCPTFY